MSDDLQDLIPIAEAAALLMVTDRWIRDLQKKGYIPKAEKRGLVSRVGAVQGYIRSLKDEERHAAKSASHSRVQDARAREIQLRIAREEGELVPLKDALDLIDEFAGETVIAVRNIPARFTRDLTVRTKLRAEIEEALGAISDKMLAIAATLKEG